MRLLIVCTGNICRSPLGEVVVRQRLADAGLAHKTTVASGGTWGGNAGSVADPRAVAAAARRGYDLVGFAARGVRRADFPRFDLMLGMTHAHVEQLEEMRARIGRCDIRRYLDFTADLTERDIADPYLGTDADFERALDSIEAGAVGIVAHVLRHCASD